MSSSSETPSFTHLDGVDANEALAWVRDGIGDEPLPLQRNSSVVEDDCDATMEADHLFQRDEHSGWMQEETQHLPDLTQGTAVEIAGKGLCVVLSADTERKTILVEGEDGRPFNIVGKSRIINTI